MLLENTKAYTTSKNDVEVILNGDYTTNGKVLNGRQRYEDADGKVFWVPVEDEIIEQAVEVEPELIVKPELTVEPELSDAQKFFNSSSSSEVDIEAADRFFASIVAPVVNTVNVVERDSSKAVWHTVDRGDTYESIAAEYGVPYSQLTGAGALYVGKKIRIK